jgi:predicted ArsR family transcriptional regulator
MSWFAHSGCAKLRAMDVPRIPGDVLAQRTRARLFARLGELRRPASTDELARELGLHRNGVRMHLERLAEAGLIVRERERRPQGRPRDAWLINPDAQPGGDPPTAYTDLSRWLARSMSAGKSRVRDVEAAGREIGRELAPEGPATTAEGIRDVLGALGFQPTSRIDRKGTLTYTLANCPYRDAVRENQTMVCALHRGLTRGLLDEMSPRTKLAGFVPKDPYTAGCLIQLQGPLADEAAGGAPSGAPPGVPARTVSGSASGTGPRSRR